MFLKRSRVALSIGTLVEFWKCSFSKKFFAKILPNLFLHNLSQKQFRLRGILCFFMIFYNRFLTIPPLPALT